MHHKVTKAEANESSCKVIGAALEVQRSPGPGLLESTCEECPARELTLRRQAHLHPSCREARLALLVNLNVRFLRHGIRRFVH